MRRKYLGLIAFMLIPGVLSACQLLPAEEVLPAAPVIHAYQAEEYDYVTVMRGDLISTTNVTAYYTLTKRQDLSFPLGGMYIDSVNVTVGQEVKAGDELASIEQDDIEAQLTAQRHDINVLNKQSKHLKETLELELSQYSAMLTSVEQQLQQLQAATPAEEEAASVQQMIDDLLLQKESLEQRSASAQDNYDRQMESVDDSLYVAYLRMEELESAVENRKLIAAMDGTVTFVEDVYEGQVSVRDKVFVTVADLDSAAFTVDAQYAQYLPVGTEVLITYNKQEHEAVVVSPADLGLEETEAETEAETETETEAETEAETEVEEEEEPIPVYLRLKNPDSSLKSRDKGTFNLVLEQRFDVLYVQKEAIQNADSDPFVYIMDEDGLRAMQSVTTGMSNNEYVEIIAGLSEDDYVIVE